jgi:ribosome recycling factor
MSDENYQVKRDGKTITVQLQGSNTKEMKDNMAKSAKQIADKIKENVRDIRVEALASVS